jgi:hypothetical protein
LVVALVASSSYMVWIELRGGSRLPARLAPQPCLP